MQIVRRKNGKAEVISTTTDLNESIQKQARALLPAAARKQYDQMAFSIDLDKTITTPSGTVLMEYTLEGQIPKAEGEMTVKGLVALKLKGDKVIAKVASAKLTK